MLADTLHRDSSLQKKLSSMPLRTSGVLSLSLHEEAVSDIVAYDSMNTSTVNDTEKMKSGLGGCYGEPMVFHRVYIITGAIMEKPNSVDKIRVF